MEGIATVQRRKRDGTSYNVYSVRYYDENHRQRHRTFPKLALAKEFRRKGFPTAPPVSAVLYETLATEWLATNPAHKVGTRNGYAGLLRKHLLPYFGKDPAASIRKQTVREFVAAMQAEGYGPGTIRNTVRNVLKPSLDLAVENGYIPTNPAQGLKLPASRNNEMLFLTPGQVKLLAEDLGDPYALLVLLDAYTGLRAGEVAALRIKHLNFMTPRPYMRVSESASVISGQGTVYGTTKTGATRTVPIPPFLTQRLMAYVAPRAKNPEAFVFLSPEGKPLNHKNFYGRHFKPAVRRLVAAGDYPAALGGLRFHDLRHTCAAIMINASGANPLQVSRRLGHSSIAVTYDRYGHLFPDSDEQLSAGLEKAYWSAEAEPDAEPATVMHLQQ